MTQSGEKEFLFKSIFPLNMRKEDSFKTILVNWKHVSLSLAERTLPSCQRPDIKTSFS